jgi:two-component system, cell cycle response regulator DivK
VKAKILYIEDNEQNFYLVNFILTSLGHEVTWAKDGREGIEAAAKVKPDIILLDIQLPVMDGYAVAKALRGKPDLAETPIVALTSYAMTGDREKAITAGCNGYIEKPINPAVFASQIEGFLPVNAPGGPVL